MILMIINHHILIDIIKLNHLIKLPNKFNLMNKKKLKILKEKIQIKNNQK